MFARYCASCPCVEGCRDAFGAFWLDKSAHGVGCNKPFDGGACRHYPPNVPKEDRITEWVDEYERRLELELTALRQLSPRELDALVVAKYGGRFKSRYGAQK